MRLIARIVIAVLITTIIAILSMFIVYIHTSNTVAVYSFDKITGDITRSGNIFYIILPALIFSALVNIGLAVVIGLYASRKYAIPIYKLEQWSSLLLKGKLTALLQFREKEEMQELSSKCNEVTHFFRERLFSIKKQVEELKKIDANAQVVKNIERALEGFDLTTEPIEVNTGYYKIALQKEKNKQ
jgi:nitrogen fixation/metabolism regulation signal transduction histidine kinase